jgi:hypothetical protein
MKTLRKLTSVIFLALVLGLPAFAGQSDTPPCAPPVPGQTDTPPCGGGAPAPGDSGTPTVSSTTTAADVTLTEIVTDVLTSMLSIF